MRKVFNYLLAVAAIAVSLTGCQINAAISEDDDIDEGKIFAIERATIQFQNSKLMITFANYGRDFRMVNEDGSEVLYRYDGKFHGGWACYELDTKAKKYSRGTTVYESWFMGRIAFMEAEAQLEGAKTGTEKVAGKTCNVYKVVYDNDKIGSCSCYKRIILKKTVGGQTLAEAASVTETAKDSDFLLDGYTEKDPFEE